MKKKVNFPAPEEIENRNKIEIRERTLRHGLAYPSNAELLMLILGTGIKSMPVQKLAKQVLEIVMASNEDQLIEKLLKIKGMGKSKALMIAAALEFGKRINRTPQGALRCPTDVISFIKNYAMEKQEHFLCISLNGAMEIISIRVVCSGTGNMAIIHPADVFSEPIKEHASAIILSHNHPSGNSAPSADDIEATLRLFHAAEILGIAMLDHIILTKTNYYSFLEHDLLDEEKLYNLL